ncbi:MAG: hemolysin family protein [Candidatus Saccharimonadales bacterium]
MNIWMTLIVALLMLAGNAFFVGAEFSLISVRRSSIEMLALKGSLTAKITLKAMERVAIMIAGAQLGVTVCSLVFGAIGEPLVEQLLEQPFHSLGLPSDLITPLSLLFTVTIMVYLHVVIGEMIPKNLSLTAPAKTALYLIPPLVLFVKIFKPAIIVIDAISRGVLHLIGVHPKQEITSSFNRDEVAGIVKESLREGLLSTKEEQLLSGSLCLDNTTIDSVIIPLGKVVFASNKPTPSEIESLTSSTGFSRFPLLGKSGQPKGYVHLKDILRLSESDYNRPLPSKLFRPLVNIKAGVTLRDAMLIMQKSGSHLAKVVDKNGLYIGVIALEDVIEKLIGEIRDDTWK